MWASFFLAFSLVFIICANANSLEQQHQISNTVNLLKVKTKIVSHLEKQYSEGKYPGASIALQLPDKEILTFTSGHSVPSKIETGMDAKQPLGIGSTTKTFVAVVILQLAQSGKLNLDESLRRWFPNLPPVSDVTPRQLLQHTSGLNEYLESEKIEADAQRAWSSEELLAIAFEKGPKAKPGEKYNYANTNYILLGQLIKKVTGNIWYQEVRSRILDPLKMKHTYYRDESFAPAVGEGYRFINGKFVNSTNLWHISLGSAAGGLDSTAEDLLIFIKALRDGKMLDKIHQNEMFTFLNAEDYSHIKSGYGLGMQRFVANDTVYYGHFGTSSAWSSFIAFEEKSGLAIAVSLNCRCTGNAPILGTELIGLTLDQDIAPPKMVSFTFSSEYFPDSFITNPDVTSQPGIDELKISVTSFKVGAGYETDFNNGLTSLTSNFEYSQLRLGYTNWNFGDSRVDTAHEIAYSGTLMHKHSDLWSTMVIATPSLASDFEDDLSIDDVMFEAAVIGIYKYSERLDLGFGGGYNPRLGQYYPMPVIGIRWNNGSNMKVEAILPMVFSFAYRPHPIVDVGLRASLDGGQYHGSPDKFSVDKPYLRYSVAKVGPTVLFRILPFLQLGIEGGYTFHRRFEFYDDDNLISPYDLDQTYYGQITLQLF